MKKGDIVVVEWFDICARTGWHYVQDARSDYNVASVGYLLESDKEAVVITQSIAEQIKCAESLTIPRVNIKKVRKIA